MIRRALGILGGAGVGLGCAAMVSMLPGAAASVLSVVGITGSSGLAITLAAVAEPLFIASAVLVVISALACSRLVTALSATGVTVLYLSMFELATSTATSGRGAMSMMAMQHSRQAASTHANAPTFYLGLVILISSAALAAWRRHRHKCRPLLPVPELRAARH
jgi:hypothetical protein